MTDSTGTRRLRMLRIVTVLIVVLALALAAYWFLTRGPGQQLVSPPRSTIMQFSGEGDHTTESFTVREGWAIQWETTADHFSFAIAGDRDFGTVIDVDEPGNGTTSPTGSGTFHLEIVADGPWSVDVTQGD